MIVIRSRVHFVLRHFVIRAFSVRWRRQGCAGVCIDESS